VGIPLIIESITSKGTKAELVEGVLYLEGCEIGVGVECSVDELEDAIEDLGGARLRELSRIE